MINPLESIKAVVFDLDGTLYIGQNAIPGAVDTVRILADSGLNICYITNSSAKRRSFYYEKLLKMGFPVMLDNVFSSGYVLARFLYLRKMKKVYCIGSHDLINEVKDFDIEVLETYDKNEKPCAVIIGLDMDFSVTKIQNALNYLMSDSCQLIVCNADKSFPVDDDLYMPGTGAMVSAVEYVSGRNHDFMVGKPNSRILTEFIDRNGYSPSEILVIGDSYESDIVMAKNTGCPSILITDSDAGIDGEHFCVKKITDILDLLKTNQLLSN